jgi:glycosyltransferase involved in cell wall biosynthesis
VSTNAETEPGLISIVIPAWGGHVEYVPDALESLRAQAVPRIEFIVADNASEPPVADMGGDVRVCRSPERTTVGKARNFGLAQAQGEYVMFWDADDVMLPGGLARMLEVIEEDPDTVAVTMDSVTWTPETGPGVPWPWPRSIMYRLARHRRLFAVVALLYNPFTTTGPALMRTGSVRDAGGFSEDIAYFEDWALAGALAVRGRVVMLREDGRHYRVHDGSLSLGHLGNPDQVDWLRGMRVRTRRDPRVPLWMKALAPLVRLHHFWREHRRVKEGAGYGYYKSALEQTGDGAG